MPEATLAREIMTDSVTSFEPSMSLLDAARTLFDNRWAGAPVVSHGEVVGVLGLADVIAQQRSVHAPTPLILFDALLYLGSRRFERELKKVTAMNVGDAMSTPVTVAPDTSVADIAALMIDEGISTLPVVEGGALVGVVGRRDVVRLVLGRSRGQGS